MNARPPSSLPTTEPSQRQLEIAALVAQGKSNKQIAAELAISTQTVKNQLTDVFDRLGCVNRAALAVWYVTQDLGR